MRIALRHILAAVAAAGLAGFLVWAFRPQPVLVDIAPVTRGPLTVTVREEAYTRVREIYAVSAPVAGRLLRIDRKVGDPVQAGETPLARILPSEPGFLDLRSRREAEAAARSAEAALGLARAELERAQAEVGFATAELQRAQELERRGILAPQTLERRQLELRTARAALESARAALLTREAELERARAALIDPSQRAEDGPVGTVQVFAPVDGRILRLLQESENVVAAGTPLLELGDPGDLEVVAELLSTDAVRIAEGTAAGIVDWGGGGVLPGRVRRIEPFGFTKVSALGIEEQRVRVLVDFEAAPPAGLGHGYRVEVEIVVWQDEDVLQVPSAALFRRTDGWAVFAVDADGRARERAVAVGQGTDRAVQILDGLRAGEAVVLHPGERVGDDVRVAARRPLS